MTAFLVTDFHVRPDGMDALLGALRRMTPTMERALRPQWLRLCTSEKDPQLTLLVTQVQTREVVEHARTREEQFRAQIQPLLDAPWTGFHAFHSLHMRMRPDMQTRAVLAVRYRLDDAERERFLAFERDLTEQLFALPQTVSSYLLEHSDRPGLMAHVVEFTDLLSLQVSVDFRLTDPRFLDADRHLFLGSVTYASGRWEATERGEAVAD